MILELKDIRLSYSKGGEDDSWLLKGVNMEAEEGLVTALVGGNGAGKTTLFNIISGFERRFEGDVFLDGRRITRSPAHRIARKGVGRLFQGRQLMEDLTVLENMKIANPNRYGEMPFHKFLRPGKVSALEADREEKAREILTRLFGDGNKYLDKLNDKASELSYGEQRLIALSRLMMMGRDSLLLLDEPTSGVNPEHIATIGRIIREMTDEMNMTVLIIEHNMDFVRSVATQCHYLADGAIVKSGTPREVLDDPFVRKDYAGL